MSSFSYFISENPLPDEVIRKAHEEHFRLSDVTKYVKDARENFRYYIFISASIYIPLTGFKLSMENQYDCRRLSLVDFYKWIIEEFSRNGDFRYIQFWEDCTKMVNNCHEAYFKKCKQEDIQPSCLLAGLTNSSRPLKNDILYNVFVTRKASHNDYTICIN